MIKKIVILATVTLAATLFTSCASKSGSCCCGSDAKPAFNGKDLKGWQSVSEKTETRLEDVWSVKDGMIICKGTPMGYLHTEKTYTDYKLEVEYRWAPGQTPGNSGLFARINGTPRPLPRCVETQLRHTSAGDLYGFHGMQINGDAARFSFKPGHQLGGDLRSVKRIEGNEVTPGEWNKVELVVKGDKITVTFNGKLVNEAFGVEQTPGFVGLQSEGGEVHFRNLKLTELK